MAIPAPLILNPVLRCYRFHFSPMRNIGHSMGMKAVSPLNRTPAVRAEPDETDTEPVNDVRLLTAAAFMAFFLSVLFLWCCCSGRRSFLLVFFRPFVFFFNLCVLVLLKEHLFVAVYGELCFLQLILKFSFLFLKFSNSFVLLFYLFLKLIRFLFLVFL